MSELNFNLRMASEQDAVTISALSIQVFLDTYATEGVRPDLAREAHCEYAIEAFVQRLIEPQRRFILAEYLSADRNGLLGFAEVLLTVKPSPAGNLAGAELVRLYIQPKAHRMGCGRSLLTRAEQLVQAEKLDSLWLTAWEGNRNARAFYERVGYADVGATTYTFQGQTYANRVLAKQFD